MQKPSSNGYDLLRDNTTMDKVQLLLREQRADFERLLVQQQMCVARLVADQHKALEEVLSAPGGNHIGDLSSCRDPLLAVGAGNIVDRAWSDASSEASSDDSGRLQMKHTQSSYQMQEAENRCQEVMLPIVHSTTFRAIMSGAVIANTLYLGMRVHWEMTNILAGQYDPRTEKIFESIQLAFFVLFTSEIVIRLAAEQKQFFCGPARNWNIFEVICLFSMAVDVIDIEDLSQVISSVSALRLLRLLRILRAARAVRIFQFMKQLRLMLFSVVSCLISMMWAILLLFLIICLFALFLEDSALQELIDMKKGNMTGPETPLDPSNPMVVSLSTHWNGMLQAIVSLIYSISGGADWGDLAEPFWIIPPFCGVAYLAFVILTIFGLLNVLVGIFVQEASELTKWDKDFVVDAFVQKRKEQQKEICDLFDSMDLDQTGKITFQEMAKALQKDNIAAYFQHLEVDIQKVEVLFHVLDSNGDGAIQKDEFLAGLRKLHGHANATDVADMILEEQKMNRKLDTMGTIICQRIDSLQERISGRSLGTR